MQLEGYNRPHRLVAGKPSASKTLAEMAREARRGASDLAVRRLSASIVQRLKGRDYPSEYAALCHWIEDHVRYVRDPVEVEHISTPAATMRDEYGDCDCMNTLLGAMLGSLGGRCRFVAGAFKGQLQRGYSHVWTEVLDPASGNWLVLDPVARTNTDNMFRRVDRRLEQNVF